MSETTSISVEGMTCTGCSGRVKDALENISGVVDVEVSHESGTAIISHSGVRKEEMVGAIQSAGYSADGMIAQSEFNWKDTSLWKQSAYNTSWCLLGCSIGEFGTLAAFQYYEIQHHLNWNILVSLDLDIIFLFMLPLINGLITSVMLETYILVRGQMDITNAFKTAMGMSFIGMLMMEIAMETTDLVFTGGQLGLDPLAIVPMLIVGFLTPWPYNYWRLKKYGIACH